MSKDLSKNNLDNFAKWILISIKARGGNLAGTKLTTNNEDRGQKTKQNCLNYFWTDPKYVLLIALLTCMNFSLSCTEKKSKQTGESTEKQLLERGKAVYVTSCSACHNSDPRLDGVAGPAIADASTELIKARVIKGEYPPGYVPKRQTKVMVALPYLENEISAIKAFLESFKP